MIPETSTLPQEPVTLGGGGKDTAGEAPGDKTTLPPPLEKEDVEDGSVVPSSSREKEREVNGSAIVLSPMEGAIYNPCESSDADVGAPGDGEREERSRSPNEEEGDDVAVSSYNFLIPVVLEHRATRSGREFAS